MFVLLLLPIVCIQSVTLPIYDEANDVKKTVDNVLVDTGDYAGEIDIYMLNISDSKVILHCENTPVINEDDYTYLINITWAYGTIGNFTMLFVSKTMNTEISMYYNSTGQLVHSVYRTAYVLYTAYNRLIANIDMSYIDNPKTPYAFFVETRHEVVASGSNETTVYQDTMDENSNPTTIPEIITEQSSSPGETTPGLTIIIALTSLTATATGIMAYKRKK